MNRISRRGVIALLDTSQIQYNEQDLAMAVHYLNNSQREYNFNRLTDGAKFIVDYVKATPVEVADE